jgi:hypothetical protein
MSAVESRYQATAIEDVTVDTSVCVYNSELQSVVSRCIKESNKSDHQSKTHLQSPYHVTIDTRTVAFPPGPEYAKF